jgi:Fic family protein
MKYNWQREDWPKFRYDSRVFQEDLYRYGEAIGRMAGEFPHLSAEQQQQATLEILVAEAIKTSAIEGEILNREDVMSSIRNNLKLNHPPVKVEDVRAQGISQLMVDVRQSFSQPMTEEKLFEWHRLLLFGVENSGHLLVGAWRRHPEPMQVVSGAYGKLKVHFEAPPSKDVPAEMQRFIGWFNRTAPGAPEAIVPGPVRAAIAHLYFETIHPFEDGNGRIGRAIAESALFQDLGRPALLSLSYAIEAQRKRYYDHLNQAQNSNEITPWISYFVKTLREAQAAAERQILFTLEKTKFFDRFKPMMNDRQQKAVARILKEGPARFEGGMNATKYMRITSCSKATATRDLVDLREKGILKPLGAGGRSAAYDLVFGDDK